MTYCVGWKYNDNVFLLADTAATKLAKPSTTYSSFGQLHAEVRGEHVEESLLKLVPLGAGTVAAYAGNVQLATQCLDFLRDGLVTTNGIRNLLQMLTANLGPFRPDRAVELLVATSAEVGKCELVRWSTVHGIDAREADFYHIGSLTSYHSALTPALLSQLVAGKLDAKRMLPIASAVVQSYGVHDNLIDMNVGGLIFGVQTALGVVTWQQDTNYVLYAPSFAFRAWITAIARDNALVISSSLTDDTRVLGHSTSMPRRDLWNEQWLTGAKAALDSAKSPCWIFISTLGKVITVIFRADVSKDSRYVRLTHCGNGKFDLALSPELMALLCQPLEDRNDGSLPFRLNVRND